MGKLFYGNWDSWLDQIFDQALGMADEFTAGLA